VFESEPFAADAVMVGTGSADLWIRSTATEADLEVTLSELRPDGKEVFVQNGWLRASHRKTGGDSTALFPRQTHLEADAAPLVPGAWTEVRVAIAGFGHAFRAGSRVRVMIDTPGDSRAAWRFDLAKVPAETVHAVAHGSMRPSSIALPLLPGVKAPSPLPACPSLRGQPCRMAVSYSNTPTN
jgi:predicted acyl esterase